MTKTVLITGGSSGIGLELAKLFAKDGYQLVLVARKREELKKAADDLAKLYKAKVHIIPTDLADPAQPKAIVEKLTRADITVDVLVNNAGFGHVGQFAKSDTDVEMGMIGVNVSALTNLTHLLLPGMVKRKSGRILNVASTAAFEPGPFMAVYYASKAYVLSFSEALFEELRGTGITVTCLCPGPTNTNWAKTAKLASFGTLSAGTMSPDVVAAAAYRATMNGKRLIIPGWSNVLTAFAVRLVPRALVLKLVRKISESTMAK